MCGDSFRYTEVVAGVTDAPWRRRGESTISLTQWLFNIITIFISISFLPLRLSLIPSVATLSRPNLTTAATNSSLVPIVPKDPKTILKKAADKMAN
jgi:hypothetical protein